MKNKIFMIMLTAGVTFFACSCGNNSDISSKPVAETIEPEAETEINSSNDKLASESLESEAEIENKINVSDEELISESTESDIEYKIINFAETITLDFVEITIDGADFGDEVMPDNPSRVYRYHSDKEGEKYIYIYGTIKNVSGDKFEFANNMYAVMTFDDKYNYNASISADEDGSFSGVYAWLNPLKSEKFYICASVPDELIEEYNKMVVNFGFTTNFEHEIYLQAEDCDYLYSITISK